jgi:ring-1,2-phenylacetyl-CoA epoxidase subunit PaaC
MTLSASPALQGARIREAVAAYLLSLADDELIIGHRHSEWTGFAPDIESDVALSSIAQEEIGHARLLYERVAELSGGDPDALAYGRGTEAFRNGVLVERPNGDWGYSVVRMVLYDHADAIRLETLAGGALGPIADLARTLRREERYHIIYGEQWLRRLAQATTGSRARVQEALDVAWPEAEALFATVEGQDMLDEPGILAADATSQRQRWCEAVLPVLAEAGLQAPTAPAAALEPAMSLDGRRGAHSEHLSALLEEMTSVWRSEPGARW